jgi:hypothetical protein
MLKRNSNLIVKLYLIAVFGILIICIASAGNTEQVAESTYGSRYEQTCEPEEESDENSESHSSIVNVLIDTPKLYSEIVYEIYYGPEPTEVFLNTAVDAIKNLEKINYSKYTSEAAADMIDELSRLKEIESKVLSDLDRYLIWEKEYYYAAKVWEYFMQRDYGEAVTIAILGNMMVETGGGTLCLEPTAYNKTGNYYGLCQWSQVYYPEAKDLPFEHQLEYLEGTMAYEFNTFGYLYKPGFTYEDFLAMTDPVEAARVFAIVYERCADWSVPLRSEAAKIAFDYFNLNL